MTCFSKKCITAILFVCISVFYLTDISRARLFVLPGIFYTDEFGLVGSLAVIMQTQNRARFESRLEYFGSDEGQVLFNVFVPRETIEWSFEGRYQISGKEVFSPWHASNHDKLGEDVQYWADFWGRCDFLKGNGLFYGLQASYKRFAFKGDPEWNEAVGYNPVLASIYTEGEEIAGSFRVGLERRDNRYNTHRGTHVLWQTDLGYAYSEGNRDELIRTQIDIRKYLPLTAEKTTLALNLRGGVIHSDVPYFSQFKIGGSLSMRGYPLDRYYGNAFFLLRTEFRQILQTDIPLPLKFLWKDNPGFENYTFSTGFVLFSELGDIWRDDEGWWGFRQNVGVGLRAIFTPDVVASIDVATPLDSDYIAIYLDLRQSF